MLRAVLICVLLLTSRLALAQTSFKLSRDEYADRVTAIWLAQMIGQATGVRFEHRMASVLPVTPPSTLPGYAPVDDDYYYEMVAVRAFQRYGIHMTVAQLGSQWLENNAGAWGSSRQALLLMRRGIMPPLTGSPRYNRLWWTIGPEFSSDLYGALAPASPNEAARMAREYGHLNGYAEGVDGGVFIAGMISIAFVQHDTPAIVKGAARLIGEGSPYREALDSVIRMAEAGRKPREIYAALVHRWGVEYPGTNNAVLNGAIVATTVWFGEGDYQKTLQLAVHAADFADTDCNAANAESVVAAMHGTRALPQSQIDALHDRVKGDSLGPEKLTPPVDESIQSLGERTAAIGEAMMRDRGLRQHEGAYLIPIQTPRTAPAEIFHLADLMTFWNSQWALQGAGFGGGDGGLFGLPGMTYLEGDVLATFPYDSVRGVVLRRTVALSDSPSLRFSAGVDQGRAWRLEIYVDDELAYKRVISASTAFGAEDGHSWTDIMLDLRKYRNRTVTVRICQQLIEVKGEPGNAYWKNLALQ